MNWKVLAGVLLVLNVPVTITTESRATVSNIKNGLSLAKELGDLVVAQKFTNVIGKLATAITPYLGIVGPFVSFITGFFVQSAELKAIKQLYTLVDNRFDKVDVQFDEVKRLIHRSNTEIQYSDIEQRINALYTQFEHFYTFSIGTSRVATSEFVANFHLGYQQSGIKLYNGIMKKPLFGEDLFSAVIKYTEYHRAKSQSFMLGVLQLLMKAATLELAYHGLKGHKAAEFQNAWSNRFTNIRNKMMSTDKAIVSQYHTQSGIDIDNYLTYHRTDKMNNFNNGLYDFLTEKYYWRDWLTVTYKDIKGGENHWVGVCGGHIVFREEGRNVVVSSVKGSKIHSSSLTRAWDVYSVIDREKYCYYDCSWVAKRCDEAFKTFRFKGCNPFVARGVISEPHYNEVHLKAAPNRSWERYTKFNIIFVFG